MTDVVFAFGPDGSYFYQSPTQWSQRGLPASLAAKFLDTAQIRIRHVYEMALGAHGSYYVGFEAYNGQIYSSMTGLPPQLETWINTHRDVRKIRVSLGPNNESFWATDDANMRYLNLPSGLQSALNQIPKDRHGLMVRNAAPRLVSLGFDGSFVMLTEGGGGNWNISSEYPHLSTQMTTVKAAGAGAFKRVHYISLNAHAREHYVLTCVDGDAAGVTSDDTKAEANKVLLSIPRTPATARGHGNRSSNLRGFLKLANTGLQLVNALNGGGGGQQGGSYQSGGGFNTSGFQTSMQQNMWSSVGSAAQDPIQ